MPQLLRLQGQGRRVIRQMRAARRRLGAARTRGAGGRPCLRLAGLFLDGHAAAPRVYRKAALSVRQLRRGYPTLAPKRAETAMIYTMNVKEPKFYETYVNDGKGPLGAFESFIGRLFTKPERVCAFNTTQFSDYSKYDADGWDEAEKKKMAGRRISEGAARRARGGAAHGGKDKGEGLASRAEAATFFERVYEIVRAIPRGPRRQLRADRLYARRSAHGAPSRLGDAPLPRRSAVAARRDERRLDSGRRLLGAAPREAYSRGRAVHGRRARRHARLPLERTRRGARGFLRLTAAVVL